MPLVSISDVISASQNGTRCLIEGERVMDGKMLITVGSLGLSDSGEELKVWALCMQSSTLSGTPHVLETTLDLTTIYKRVKEISCSCKAGKSEKCKHCIALLMFLNRIDDASDLEDLSCTDLTQQWGKLKQAALSEFEAVPLTKFCHYIPPKAIYGKGLPNVSDDLAAEFAKIIIKGAPNSELFLHSSGARAKASRINCRPDTLASKLLAIRQAAGNLSALLLEQGRASCFLKLVEMTEAKKKTVSPEQLHYYQENVELSSQQCIELASNTATQCEDEWNNARRIRVTGTKVYELKTYTKNKKPDWAGKMKKVFDSGFSGTAATMYGLEQEPFAREAYAKKHKVKVVENGIFVHPHIPWLGTSVDGVVVNDQGDPLYIIEIKCLTSGKKTTAANMPEQADCWDNKLNQLRRNHKYNGQIQLALFLTGLSHCDFIFYSSLDKTCEVKRVNLDETFVWELLEPVLNVYFNTVLPYLFETSKKQSDDDGDANSDDADDVE